MNMQTTTKAVQATSRSASEVPIDSPRGHYQPQVLLLAPETGDDAHSRSLASHFLELGVPIELTDDWLLPSAPPRDLNQYRVCLFPQSSKPRYDRDLNAFARDGGHLVQTKYYPDAAQVPSVDISHFIAYGRDVYLYGLAQSCTEHGLTLNDPAFLATLQRRPNTSMLANYQRRVTELDAVQTGPLPSWGDRVFTRAWTDIALARHTRDPFWDSTSRQYLERLRESIEQFIVRSPDGTIPSRYLGVNLADTSSPNPAMMGMLLMQRGRQLGDSKLIEAGIQAGMAYERLSRIERGIFYPPSCSEKMWGVGAFAWLAALTNEAAHLRSAEAMFRSVMAPCQHGEGLWAHSVTADGRRSALWSRGTQWPVLVMTHTLEALPADSPLAEQMRGCLERTYAALERHQDRQRGLWHLVMNEPDTRLESSATATLTYCHDRLRELGVLDNRYTPMIERAFQGLKTVYYAGGLGATCRGTAFGTPEYYRTRPMGWYDSGTLFPATLGPRLS